MKLKTLTYIVFILAPFSLVGQSLYLSNGLIENEQFATNSNHSINIDNYSGFNKVIFNSTSVTIANPVLVVSKKGDSLFQPVKWIKLKKVNAEAVYTSDINWNEDGDYKLTITDGDKELINDYYTVNVNEDDELTATYSSDDYSHQYNDPNSTFYYIDSKVEFCESMNTMDEPVNVKSESPIGNVTIFVSNTKPIITKDLKVSIYKIKGKDNEELVEEKYFPITSGSMNVSFNYYFGTKGSFLLSVYANEDVWVNDGNIKIK